MSAQTDVVAADEKKLSAQLERRKIDDSTWNTLKNSIFPGGSNTSILMALDYCIARKLDVLKKPVHIVPMKVKQGKDYIWRDVIMPGIVELRTTAMRTKEYAGMERPEWGPMAKYGAEANPISTPESCTFTVYRYGQGGAKIPFYATAYFEEAVGMTNEGDINSMWSKRPRGQLEKCAEAAALRRAFPEELGGIYVPEEMEGQTLEGQRTEPTVVQGSRADAAEAQLRARLSSNPQKPFNANPNYDFRESEPAQQEQKPDASIQKSRESEWEDPRPQDGKHPQATKSQDNSKPQAEGPKAKQIPTVNDCKAMLKSAKTLAALEEVMTTIIEAYEFAGVKQDDFPIEIDAFCDMRREQLEAESK